jgi:hypothetical protein
MTPCSPLSYNRSFGEHISSVFRVEEIGSAKPASQQVASKMMKMLIFITTGVKTSNITTKVIFWEGGYNAV